MTETPQGGPKPRAGDPAPGWFGGYTTKSGKPVKRKPAPAAAPPPPPPAGLRGEDDAVLILRGGRVVIFEGYSRRSEYDAALRADPCAYCGKPGGTLDHLVPKALGGARTVDNLVGACRLCNGAKGELPLLEWLLVRAGKIARAKEKRRARRRNWRERRRKAREERERKASRMMGWEHRASS